MSTSAFIDRLVHGTSSFFQGQSAKMSDGVGSAVDGVNEKSYARQDTITLSLHVLRGKETEQPKLRARVM